jgi:hypothetical protein
LRDVMDASRYPRELPGNKQFQHQVWHREAS